MKLLTETGKVAVLFLVFAVIFGILIFAGNQ